MKLRISAELNQSPIDIKAALCHKFGTIAELARRTNVRENTLSASLIRPQPSGNFVIARSLGYTVHQLWPEWFGPDGQRLHARHVQPKSVRGATARQKGAAA